MTEDDVVHAVRTYIEGLFPRSCPNCGRKFRSLREYLQTTTHIDSPILYEPIGEAIVLELGPMSLANCPCGTTLTIGSREMPVAQMITLLKWGRAEASRRQIGMRELLHHLRDRIDAQVLGDSD